MKLIVANNITLNKLESRILSYCKGKYGWHANKTSTAITTELRAIIEDTACNNIYYYYAIPSRIFEVLHTLALKLNTLVEYNNLMTLTTLHETFKYNKSIYDTIVTQVGILQRTKVIGVTWDYSFDRDVDKLVNPHKYNTTVVQTSAPHAQARPPLDRTYIRPASRAPFQAGTVLQKVEPVVMHTTSGNHECIEVKVALATVPTPTLKIK